MHSSSDGQDDEDAKTFRLMLRRCWGKLVSGLTGGEQQRGERDT